MGRSHPVIDVADTTSQIQTDIQKYDSNTVENNLGHTANDKRERTQWLDHNNCILEDVIEPTDLSDVWVRAPGVLCKQQVQQSCHFVSATAGRRLHTDGWRTVNKTLILIIAITCNIILIIFITMLLPIPTIETILRQHFICINV